MLLQFLSRCKRIKIKESHIKINSLGAFILTIKIEIYAHNAVWTHAFEVIRFDSARLDFGLLLCAMEKFSAANMNIISELISIGFHSRLGRSGLHEYSIYFRSTGVRALRVSRLISSARLYLAADAPVLPTVCSPLQLPRLFEVQKATNHRSEYLPINNCSAVSVAGNKKSLTSSDGVDRLRYPNAQRSSDRSTKSHTQII